ncbi:hypothetical protein CVT26_012887 [Gymnopilus dilepis]|uniref:Uncharacterized protein n=1 Tax=Gymnopilus dilepis TaxID=231916 RepID=A0A409YP39_9AGAR|nr:hypothetical protein CVT26_012887 [Gymnopilus dilepis]
MKSARILAILRSLHLDRRNALLMPHDPSGACERRPVSNLAVADSGGFSVDFLDFYAAILGRSCDAVNALATSLNAFKGQRGLNLLNEMVFSKPFFHMLGVLHPASTQISMANLLLVCSSHPTFV